MSIVSKRIHLLSALTSSILLFLAQPAASESLAPDILTVDFSCSFSAHPQGFRYTVRRYTYKDGRQEQHISLQSIQPAYFARSVHPDIKNSMVNFSLVGEQDIGNLYGGLAGYGYFRDTSGAPIDGNVWLIEDFAGPYPFPQTSNIYTKILTGSGVATDCIDESSVRHQMNVDSPQRPAGFPQMPIVSGVSRAFNNHTPLLGSGATGNGAEFAETDFDWINDQSFHAARILSLMKGVAEDDWGDYITIEHPGLEDSLRNVQVKLQIHNSVRAAKIENRLKALNIKSAARLSKVRDTSGDNGSLSAPKPVAIAVVGASSAVGATLDSNGVSDFSDEAMNDIYTAFVGFFTANPKHGKPIVPPSFGSSQTANLIYPAYLYDTPKLQSFYEGNAVDAREKYGPNAIQYTHAPLPSQCNPNNPNYTQPAFFNSEVLEELAADWKYLNQSNWNKLRDKGFDFYESFFTEFLISCEANLDNADIDDTTDCTNDFVVAESNNPEGIIYPPLPYQSSPEFKPIQFSSTRIGRNQNSQEKTNSDKYQRKTDGYYTDLIDNKLLTMNPQWSSLHRQSCVPVQTSVNAVSKPSTVKEQRLRRGK